MTILCTQIVLGFHPKLLDYSLKLYVFARLFVVLCWSVLFCFVSSCPQIHMPKKNIVIKQAWATAVYSTIVLHTFTLVPGASCHCAQMPDKEQFKGGRAYLGSCFEGRQSTITKRAWWGALPGLAYVSLSQEAERGAASGCEPQGPDPSDPLPPARPHFSMLFSLLNQHRQQGAVFRHQRTCHIQWHS